MTVLLADDQALVRSGFQMILSVEEDIQVVGGAANGQQAVDLARQLRPDIILMDVQMPVLDGIAATRQIVAEELSRVVILTTFDRDDYLFDALEAGAAGFLLKNAEPERLVDAIRVVANGQALLAPDVTTRVIRRMVGREQDATVAAPAVEAPAPTATGGVELPHGVELTARETEVLRLVAEGYSNHEVAQELFVGEATVKTHVSNLLAKLGVRDRVQAVVWAHRAGITR
ncbi:MULTISPECIES: response regulator transcription factor [unclassified Luteococcus]|uniref:response regulator transcription factor n=1 Tax=unclassified Luteococcus TaxID=2639923 RepID=UPI00313E5D58